MKTIKAIIQVIVLIIVVLTAHSCWKDSEYNHWHIPFKNNTEKRMYVDFYYHDKWLPYLGYPDTLFGSYDPSNPAANGMYLVEPYEEDYEALFSLEFTWEGGFIDLYDTLMIFVFDADTLETLGWDQVRTNYKVLQRYDLRLEDLQYLGFRLCFPPEEKMKHIHMWPPYGTYDENGWKK